MKDITALVTPAMVTPFFPATPRANIARHLPHVLAELSAAGIGDIDMTSLSLGTIAAETEGFVPISEGQSRFNTSPHGHPFDLYDNRRDLGNRGAPDGASFRGRGFVQLTGRYNYGRYGGKIGVDLIAHPELANAPAIAAKLLARFLKDHEGVIRAAVKAGDLEAMRRAVNGGLHGLEAFARVFAAAEDALPDGGG